uniref:G-protein coupled receptors family 1 profile domain-containing protein n=1 Tax=Neolamprologus brichardi TaxID=32507 RepID=A0A3Q4HRP1_NEOBR
MMFLIFTNAEMNLTYITFGGHVEVEKYRYLYFVIMFMVYVLIICSNSTIVWLIIVQKSLHEPMYIFIAALLVNSVILTCLFQVFLFYALSCSEFLLLSAMAYDSYVSTCKPLQYPTITRRTRVNIFLLCCWFLPAIQVAVPIVGNTNTPLCNFTLKDIFCNNSVNHLYCVNSRELSIYGMVVLFSVALSPMFFILFTYIKIIIVAYQSCGNVRKKAAQTCLPHVLVLINYSCLLTYDMVIVRLESEFPKTARFIMTLQFVTYNPLCNPIIYGLKMKEISKHLKILFS